MNELQLFILCLTANVVFGLRNGAPAKACKHMAPGHFMSGLHGLPISRQDVKDSPFGVKAEIAGRYVRLLVTGSAAIQGFLIQARQTENGSPIGKFKLQRQSNDSIAKYQNCLDNEFSTITHTNPKPKTNLTFLWSPDSNENITVTFYATLARNHDVFYVMQPSNKINTGTLLNGTPGESLMSFYTLSSLLLLAFIIDL